MKRASELKCYDFRPLFLFFDNGLLLCGKFTFCGRSVFADGRFLMLLPADVSMIKPLDALLETTQHVTIEKTACYAKSDYQREQSNHHLLVLRRTFFDPHCTPKVEGRLNLNGS